MTITEANLESLKNKYKSSLLGRIEDAIKQKITDIEVDNEELKNIIEGTFSSDDIISYFYNKL